MRKTEYPLVWVSGICLATKRSRVRQALREKGWSLVVAGLFFALLAGQTLAEFREYNDERTAHVEVPVAPTQ